MATSMFSDSRPEQHVSSPAAEGNADADPQMTGAAAAASDRDDDSVDDVAVQKAQAEKLTRWQKIKRHFRRFCLWYLIGSIIFLAILLPIVFKIVVPAIVQLVVNNQSLPINGGALAAVSSTLMSLSLNTSLNTPLPVTIDPFKLALYNKDTVPFTPFLYIDIPQQYVYHETELIITNQTMGITNMTELVKWFNKIYDQETVDVSVSADPVVHLGVLTSQPHLDKTVSVPGLNRLNGAFLKTLNLIMPPENGINLQGSIDLPNWSVLSLNLGNLTLSMYSGDLNLGYVNVYNTLLNPGNTTKEFEGVIYLDVIGKNLGQILQDQTGPLSKGQLELQASGNSTVVNGQHIGYLEAVLNTKKVPLDISVIQLLSAVLNGFLHGGKTSLIDALGDILGNRTFVEHLVDNFNSTSYPTGNSTVARRVNAKRASARGNMAWNMLKLGMKMHAKREL